MSDHTLMQAPLSRDVRFEPLANLAERLSALDLAAVLVYLVDTVDASVLPHLAEQYGILDWEAWLIAEDDAQRRALIKSAIAIKRHNGTPWAVLKVFETLGIGGGVREWFEYGGPPYTFSLALRLAPHRYSEALKRRLVAQVKRVKNVRSTVAHLAIVLIQPKPFVFAGGVGGGYGSLFAPAGTGGNYVSVIRGDA